jgi:hypothetical protein
MRKSIIIILIIFGSIVFATERSSLNLKVPSGLGKRQLVFEILHRFYGKLSDSYIGIEAGSNFDVGLRYRLMRNLEASTSFTRNWHEYTFDVGYAFDQPKFLKSQIDLQYFRYKSFADPQATQNLFYQVFLQTEPIFKKISPVVNIGYDGQSKRIGAGLGIDFGFNLQAGPIQSMNIIGEYFPVFNRDLLVTYPKNSFAAGIKLNTWGHQFMLLV